jgi:hypothetical protein
MRRPNRHEVQRCLKKFSIKTSTEMAQLVTAAHRLLHDLTADVKLCTVCVALAYCNYNVQDRILQLRI